MKKVFALLLAGVMLLGLLSACGKKTETPTDAPTGAPTEAPTEAQKDLDLEQIYNAIIATVSEGHEELVMFPESSADVMNSFYPGLSELTFKQQVLYMPPISGWASEIMLVEAPDEASAKKTAEVFQARIDLGADDTAYPDTAAAWATNAKVQRSGNYVAMIALPSDYTIPEDVFSLEPAAAGAAQ